MRSYETLRSRLLGRKGITLQNCVQILFSQNMLENLEYFVVITQKHIMLDTI
jgi:hypothetical protein